jgi:hypothetical protein
VIIVDTLLIGGLRFVLRRIADAVDAQLNDVDAIREELLAGQMRLELGEIGPEEFAALERDLLARLRDIRTRAGGDDALRITGIDVSVAGDDSADDRRPR